MRRARQLVLPLLLLVAVGLCFVPWDKLLQPRRSPTAAETVSADPTVLQVEIFLPPKQSITLGSNMTMGMIDGKMALVTELHPLANQTTDLELGEDSTALHITASLLGQSPPYAVEFRRRPADGKETTASASQRVDFPQGTLTRARIFGTFDIRAFYGNAQRKRPKT